MIPKVELTLFPHFFSFFSSREGSHRKKQSTWKAAPKGWGVMDPGGTVGLSVVAVFQVVAVEKNKSGVVQRWADHVGAAMTKQVAVAY